MVEREKAAELLLLFVFNILLLICIVAVNAI